MQDIIGITFTLHKENTDVKPTPRPKNLNLLTIRFPLPAIVSILHRISGVLLFLSIPIALAGLSYSLTASGFDTLQSYLSTFWAKSIFLLFLIPFCYHLVAGIRHLLADLHLGDSLKGGRLGAKLTIGFSILLIILAGVWIW